MKSFITLEPEEICVICIEIMDKTIYNLGYFQYGIYLRVWI